MIRLCLFLFQTYRIRVVSSVANGFKWERDMKLYQQNLTKEHFGEKEIVNSNSRLKFSEVRSEKAMSE